MTKGATGENRSAAPKPAARLPLERQVGELLVMSFDGPSAPAYLRRRLAQGKGSGVILFARNAPDRARLASVTKALQRAARGRAIVATDQEGGAIRSLPFAEPEASAPALDTSAEAAASAATGARDLRKLGVNVDLAPVADVTTGSQSIGAGRNYPGDARSVARLVSAAVRGFARGGVGATAKHFPGLGRATVNTDDASVTIPATRVELSASELLPFQGAIAAGVPLVMASHAVYPAIDASRIASQSRAVLDGLLRRDLGFRGAVITDSIEAQAVLDRSGVGVAAERSVAAGADLILMTGSGSWNEVQPRLLARARRDPRFRARVAQAASRVLALKRRLGLVSRGDDR